VSGRKRTAIVQLRALIKRLRGSGGDGASDSGEGVLSPVDGASSASDEGAESDVVLELAPFAPPPPATTVPSGLPSALAFNSLAQQVALTSADALPPDVLSRLAPEMRAALAASSASFANVLALAGEGMRGGLSGAAPAAAPVAAVLGAPLIIPAKFYNPVTVRR
jgi:hypothetical protein